MAKNGRDDKTKRKGRKKEEMVRQKISGEGHNEEM